MERDEAFKLLRSGPEGVQKWNDLMATGQEMPSLQDAFLIHADLRSIDLRGANLSGVSFCEADLSGANLAGALLAKADFRGADLRAVKLHHANLCNAVFGGTLISSDLSRTEGLDSIIHASRSIVDVQAILHFRETLPEVFLRGCGLADEEIAHFRERVRSLLPPSSCFIYHCSGEDAFATRLHHDFQQAGIRCWKWNHEAQICEELLTQESPAMSFHDKVVLIASERSLTCETVNREIGRIIREESRRAELIERGEAQGDLRILYPVRLDAFVFEQADGGKPLWEHPCRDAFMNRPIIDASGWNTQRGKYAQVQDQLTQALKSACHP